MLWTAEIVLVFRLPQPTLLTGFLTRQAALRLRTVLLHQTGTWMRIKQLLATKASTTLILFHGARILLARIMPRIRYVPAYAPTLPEECRVLSPLLR